MSLQGLFERADNRMIGTATWEINVRNNPQTSCCSKLTNYPIAISFKEGRRNPSLDSKCQTQCAPFPSGNGINREAR